MPAFKKGDKSLAANYRPISLTCILCKVLEHIHLTKFPTLPVIFSIYLKTDFLDFFEILNNQFAKCIPIFSRIGLQKMQIKHFDHPMCNFESRKK